MNKIVLITGATSGIGLACARKFAENGDRLILTGRNEQRLNEIKKELTDKGRDVLTLDLDEIPGGQTGEILRRVDALGCAYAVYSTRKHSPEHPRLRVLIPTARTVSADEYEPIARKTARKR